MKYALNTTEMDFVMDLCRQHKLAPAIIIRTLLYSTKEEASTILTKFSKGEDNDKGAKNTIRNN